METYVLFFILVVYLSQIKSDLFSALVDLETLIATESHLTATLENYVKAEEKRMSVLKRYVSLYRQQYDEASQDVQTYVANPINAYTLIKRLTTDWKEVEKLIDTNSTETCLQNIRFIRKTFKFPNDDDLKGAVGGLNRLQVTYRLDTAAMARGEINGVKYSSELSAADCFHLGKLSYNNENYYHTMLWMREAEALFSNKSHDLVELSDILDYLAFSTYQQGNTPQALNLTSKLLDLVPTHQRALDNKHYYEYELMQDSQSLKREAGPEEVTDEEVRPYPDRTYEQLCRGEIKLPAEKAATLKCRYLSKNHKFLLIAPLKVEEVYHEPDIYVFHNVVADSEIETFKRLAIPIFNRSSVGTAKNTHSHLRVSKTAWLKNESYKHVADVVQRVSDMTGLSMSTSESFQVLNYGIGGHYVPHYDVFQGGDLNRIRIATVLFYMNDVEQGGATVFLKIKISVKPQKGSALFWYNLHPSGDGDKRTLHGACPVLIGSKWIFTKWPYQLGQTFLRPCTLEKPSEDLIINH